MFRSILQRVPSWSDLVRRYPGYLAAAIAVPVLLLLVVAAVAFSTETRDRTRDAVDREAEGIVFAALLDSDRFIIGRIDMLRVVAQAPELGRDPQDRELNDYLRKVVEASALTAVGVVTTDGYLRAYTDGLPSGPINVGDLSIVSDVLRTRRPAIADRVTISRATGHPTFTVAVPVTSAEGEVIRVLSTPIRLDGSLEESLRFGKLPGLRAVGPLGNMILTGQPISELRPPPNQALLAARAETGRGLLRGRGLMDEPDRLIAWRTSELSGWTMYYEQPIEQAYAGANGNYSDQLLQIAVFVVLALLAVGGTATALQLRAGRVLAAEAVAAQEAQRRHLLVAALSHDINNPMTAIGGYAALIARPSISRERATELAQNLQVQVRRVSRLLASLVDATDEQRPPAAATSEECELVSVVQRLVEDLAKSHDRRVVLHAEAEQVYGQWEQLAVERAIDNLLSNACKYSAPDTEVRVRIARTTTDGRTEAIVEVEDKGIGIPSAELTAVLEPFHRGSNVGSRSGSGVGLASVRQIMEDLGGTVSIRSREGSGTTVSLRLPLVQETEP